MIITRLESHGGKKLDPAKVIELFQHSVEYFDEQHLKEIIHYYVTKIYANIDGSFTVNVGEFLFGCGCSYGIYSKEPVISRVYGQLRSSIYP